MISSQLAEIFICEKSPVTGMGMPYNPLTTDRYNLSNISSEELPELTVTLADWLRAQDVKTLAALDLTNVQISEDAIYSRLTLGRYLHSQYEALFPESRTAAFAFTCILAVRSRTYGTSGSGKW